MRIVLGKILQYSDLDEFKLTKVIMLVEIVLVMVLLLVDLVLHLELKAVLRRHCYRLRREQRYALAEGNLLIRVWVNVLKELFDTARLEVSSGTILIEA